MKDRVAVLIHGCHLQALMIGDAGVERWEDIVWGIDDTTGKPSLRGRATMGIKVAYENDADLVIFSTGASEREGVKEGRYTYNWALENLERLANTLDMNEDILGAYLQSFGEVDDESQNTREECERNFRLCARVGIDRIVLVSSPWHIQRCHTEALKVAEALRLEGVDVPQIVAVASHGSTKGIVILEPPHRGDRPRTIWHDLAPRFFRVPESRIESFAHELGELFAQYEA